MDRNWKSKQFDVTGNQEFKTTLPENIITATAYPVVKGKFNLLPGQIDLIPMIKNSELNWKAPSGNWKIIVVYKTTVKTSFDPMNPLSGQKLSKSFTSVSKIIVRVKVVKD